LPVFIFQQAWRVWTRIFTLIYHIKASDALSRRHWRHWAADVSFIVFIVIGPARVRVRKPPFSAGCRGVYPPDLETPVKGVNIGAGAKREDSFPAPHSQGPRHRPRRVGLLPVFLNPSWINAKRADLNPRVKIQPLNSGGWMSGFGTIAVFQNNFPRILQLSLKFMF